MAESLYELSKRARPFLKGSLDPGFDIVFDAEAWHAGKRTLMRGTRASVGKYLRTELEKIIAREQP